MIMGVGSNFYMDLKFIKVHQEGTQKWLIHTFWPRFISKIFIGSHVSRLSIEGGGKDAVLHHSFPPQRSVLFANLSYNFNYNIVES